MLPSRAWREIWFRDLLQRFCVDGFFILCTNIALNISPQRSRQRQPTQDLLHRIFYSYTCEGISHSSFYKNSVADDRLLFTKGILQKLPWYFFVVFLAKLFWGFLQGYVLYLLKYWSEQCLVGRFKLLSGIASVQDAGPAPVHTWNPSRGWATWCDDRPWSLDKEVPLVDGWPPIVMECITGSSFGFAGSMLGPVITVIPASCPFVSSTICCFHFSLANVS